VPPHIKTYHERFAGGASLFWDLANERRFDSAVLTDKCEDLVITYHMVKYHIDALIRNLIEWQQFLDDHIEDMDKVYYALRDHSPTFDMDRAIRFLVLNKLCFRGLYRVNAKGKFNTPFGNYNTNVTTGELQRVVLFDEDLLRACSTALQTTRIDLASYEGVVHEAVPGDLVYFDPPYVPTSDTANFVAYHGDGFTFADQEKLRDVFAALVQKGVRCILSNAEAGRMLYTDVRGRDGPPVLIESVTVRRAINAKNPGSSAPEIIVVG
jgi:DNA adenine methylase